MKEVESKTEDLSTTTLCTAAPFGSLAEVIKTNKIEPLNGNFCELGSLLTKPTQSSDKDGPCIVPATFKNDIRCTENAVDCHFLAYDLDNLPVETDLEALTSNISSFSHMAYSTYSHKTEGKGNRYRVLLELASPIPADEYSSLAANFAHRHLPGINTDKSCLSPIQPLLLPLVHPDRKDEYEYSINTGNPLDWKKYVAKPVNVLAKRVESLALITVGHRNTSVFQHGIDLLKHGTNKEAILGHLFIFNQKCCRPPLDANEVVAISESVMASNIAKKPREDKLTQLSLARIAAESYGKTIRWVPHFNSWVSLDEKTYLWETVDESFVIGLMIAEIEKLRELEANLVRASLSSTAARIKQIENAESRNFLKGAVDLLKSCNGINTDSREFDKNDLIVGLKNKQCLDLTQSSVREIRPDDYLTKSLASHYDKEATCPLWERSILEWCEGNDELVAFLQEWCGYALSGLTQFQGFLFLYGDGRNGKSVFVNVISTLLNSYSMAMNSESLMLQNRSGGTASGDIARLAGARLVTSNELPEGRMFNENLIKQLTGGDTITARHLYASEFDFQPKLKLLICGNHKPIVTGTDNAFWRRVYLVPFEAHIEHPDPSLTDKLLAELPGILNWCLEGWKRCGMGTLSIPKVVQNNTNEYKDEMDLIKQWVDACCIKQHGESTQSNLLYQSYKEWSIRNGFKPLSSSSFSRKIKFTFGKATKKSMGNYYEGIKLKL